MCGRLNLSDLDGIRQLMAQIGMPLFGTDHTERFNVSPASTLPVLYRPDGAAHPGSGEPTLTWTDMHWGMPVTTGSSSSMAINARSETAKDKPLFRHLVQSGRALVTANGFYEWLRHGPRLRPFHVTSVTQPALLMAALWRVSSDGRAETVILTTAANADMTDIHHRMPICLNTEDSAAWINGDLPWAYAISPSQPGQLRHRELATHVNDARHDHPNCLDPIASEPHTKDLFD